MVPKKQTSKQKNLKKLPVKVSQSDFNQLIKPHLRRPKKGPEAKISYYKIFNYILFVLHTGIQWKCLPVYRNEISWQTVYHYHNRWSKDGSYQRLFESSLLLLDRRGMLDLSILHGDGTNVVAKKGGLASAILVTNTRKERKPLP